MPGREYCHHCQAIHESVEEMQAEMHTNAIGWVIVGVALGVAAMLLIVLLAPVSGGPY
jgi:heme/copper-type cytochrome/quinol oxidase subunit 2